MSLRVAGIPWQVTLLWDGLRQTTVPRPERALTAGRKTLRDEARHYHATFNGRDQTDCTNFDAALTKLLCYEAWVVDGKFPGDRVRKLISRGAARDADEDVKFLIEDIDHLASLSKVVAAARPTRVRAVRASGMAESAEVYQVRDAVSFSDPTETEEAEPGREKRTSESSLSDAQISEAEGILGARWATLEKRIIGPSQSDRASDSLGMADICSLLIALYTERSGRINKSNEKFHALRDWVRNARVKNRKTPTSVNFFLVSVALGAVAAFLLHFAAIRLGYVDVANTSSDVRASLIFGFRLSMLAVPGLIPMFAYRELSDSESRWYPWVTFFRPPFLQYLLFFLVAWGSAFVFQGLFTYVEPRLEGTPASFIQLSELLDRPFLYDYAFSALAGAAFATAVSLIFDQEQREVAKGRAVLGFSLLGLAGIAVALLADPYFGLVLQPVVAEGSFESGLNQLALTHIQTQFLSLTLGFAVILSLLATSLFKKETHNAPVQPA